MFKQSLTLQFFFLNFFDFGSVWIELIVAETENWKYCSKIIFKCVNSIMRPIFNIFNAWTVYEQYVNSEPMWGYCSRAEKKTWNWKRKNKHYPSAHFIIKSYYNMITIHTHVINPFTHVINPFYFLIIKLYKVILYLYCRHTIIHTHYYSHK